MSQGGFMSFDLTIVFTGLIGFVENSYRNSKARMCGLAIDGEIEKKSTFDSSKLRMHRSFVKFPIDAVSSLSNEIDKKPMDETFGLWYLRRDRVLVEITETSDAPFGVNDFYIERMNIPDTGHPKKPADVAPEDRDSYTWSLGMGKVFPRFKVDPLLLSAKPPARSVAAQVVIDRGKVRTKSFTRALWGCDTTLSGKKYEQVFAHEIMVSYRSLAAARLVAVSFDTPDRRKYLDLTALQRGGKLEIHVINVCDCNPLQWPNNDDPTPDEDTKWIFELTDPSLHEEIRGSLAGKPLPIPRPIEIIKDGTGAPGSGNCIPPDLSKAPFTFVELDGPNFVGRES
jgi:hypothetical protein